MRAITSFAGYASATGKNSPDGWGTSTGRTPGRSPHSIPANQGASSGPPASRFVTDSWFVQPARKMLRGMKLVSAPAFQYHFTRASRRYPALGAPHAIELRYVFNTFDPATAKKEDRELAAKMMKYWVRFAKTGDPNVEGSPPGPNTTVKNRPTWSWEVRSGRAWAWGTISATPSIVSPSAPTPPAKTRTEKIARDEVFRQLRLTAHYRRRGWARGAGEQKKWGERGDLNPRPPGPQPSALAT